MSLVNRVLFAPNGADQVELLTLLVENIMHVSVDALSIIVQKEIKGR